MPTYQYTQEKIDSLIRAISRPRFSKYQAFVGNGRDEDACELYRLNIKLSGVFLLPLHVLEVLLRNACDEAIGANHGRDWLVNGQVQLVAWQKKSVDDKCRYEDGMVSVDSFDLGFWVQFFSPHKRDLWRFALHKMFRSRPKPFKQDRIYDALDTIRHFRNRVAHHEQIIRVSIIKNHRLDRVLTPPEYLASCIEVIGWFNAEAAEWVVAHEQVTAVWQEIEGQKAERDWTGF